MATTATESVYQKLQGLVANKLKVNVGKIVSETVDEMRLEEKFEKLWFNSRSVTSVWGECECPRFSGQNLIVRMTHLSPNFILIPEQEIRRANK